MELRDRLLIILSLEPKRLQKRQVSKVLLDGLYDQGNPISKLFAVRTEVLGEFFGRM